MRKTLLILAAAAMLALAFAGTASASGSSCYYSPRGCVSVGGYYKPSTSSYVSPYLRNYPGYGSYYGSSSYRYRAPTYRYHAPSYRSYSYTPSYRSYGW